MALPLAAWTISIAALLLVAAATAFRSTSDSRAIDALLALDGVRRDLWTARQIVYPDGRASEVAAGCLLLRTVDGELVLLRRRGDRLVRRTLATGRERTICDGIDRFVVRCHGARPVVRLGLSWRWGFVVTSATPLSMNGTDRSTVTSRPASPLEPS